MVVSYQRSFDVVQPFTSDPREVLAAMRSLRKHTGGRTTVDSERRDIIDNMRKYQEESQAGRGYSNEAAGYHSVLGQIKSFADEEANRLQFTIDAIRGVVTTLAGLPGKKSIVYVSNGLPMIAGMVGSEISRICSPAVVAATKVRSSTTVT